MTVRIDKESLIVGLLFLFLALSIVQAYYLNGLSTLIFNEAEKVNEETRPAIIQLVKIVDSSCENCFDINQIVNLIQDLNVNVTKSETLEYSSPEAKQMISQFNIKKVPALIFSGETNKSTLVGLWSQIGAKRNDGTYYIESLPPYRNLTSGNIEGLASLITVTDNSCSSCYNPSIHKSILLRFGIKPTEESVHDRNSTEGNQLLVKYNITNVPTILVSPDAKVYTSFVQVWESVGTVESDGWFIFRATEQMGNYTDLTTGKLVGR